jgi:PmbA protein
MIGAGTTPTGKFPVLFEPETAMGLLAHLFEAVSGTNLYRKSSYLTGKLGQSVASSLVTVVDDPLLRKGLGSTVCDSEGVATRRQVLVDAGTWKIIPTDSYSARKLETNSTGNGGGGAVRSYNLFIANGETPKEELLKKLDTGLYVTSFIGFGFNLATGDFSRGARGYWVEKGKQVRPVQEITVSGNLDEMLKNVVAVGNDLEHRFGTDSPSLLIKDVTVSGGER